MRYFRLILFLGQRAQKDDVSLGHQYIPKLFLELLNMVLSKNRSQTEHEMCSPR